MEQAAVASLHRTMRVLREELEEREATIRRLRRRQGRRRWAGVGGRGILVTMEEAGSEDHQRMFHQLQDQLITGHQVRAAGIPQYSSSGVQGFSVSVKLTFYQLYFLTMKIGIHN